MMLSRRIGFDINKNRGHSSLMAPITPSGLPLVNSPSCACHPCQALTHSSKKHSLRSKFSHLPQKIQAHFQILTYGTNKIVRPSRSPSGRVLNSKIDEANMSGSLVAVQPQVVRKKRQVPFSFSLRCPVREARCFLWMREDKAGTR